MPRLTASVPRYRKHKASGQAVVTLNGRDFYLGPHGTRASKREYDRLVAEWLERDRFPLQVEADLTVVELAARYWKFAKAYYKKDGRCTKVAPAIKCALRYMKDWYGRTPVQDFGPLALKAVRQRMVDDGLSRRYVNDHIDRIKRMFKWGVGEELVPASTYEALKVVSALRQGRTKAHETAPVTPVDEARVDAILPFLPEVVADMVAFQRYTGCRPAEVCIVRPRDIDQSGEVWTYRPASHKTEHHGHQRVIMLGSRVQGILLKYLARDPNTYCFRPCDSEEKRRAEAHHNRKTPPSYGNSPGTNRKRKPRLTAGECYTTDSYRRAIHRACDKAGVPRWSPNRLRHAAATEIRKRFGLEAAQVVLGHSQADVTQVYAERDLDLAAQVAREVG